MFRMNKSLDVITLFHKASSPASLRVATLLKTVSANSAAPATEDQASDHTAQTHPKRPNEFELNITEDSPTADQVQTILEYVGPSGVPSVIKGATSKTDALKKFKSDASSFQKPLIVDWNNGKALANDNESEILKMLNALNDKK